MRIGFDPAVRIEANLTLLDGGRGSIDGRVTEEPLLAEIRFDRDLAAFAVAHVMGVRLDFEQEPLRLEFFDDGLAGVHAIEAAESCARRRGHDAVGTNHQCQRQLMALRHFVVGGIVGGSDLDAAGAELGIDRIIRDDGEPTVLEGEEAMPADQGLVAGIGRVHGHGLVPEHRFGAGGGHDDECVRSRLALVVQQRVFEVPQAAALLGHDHLLVGECRAGRGIPIHHPSAAIDESFAVEVHEDPLDAAGILGIHGESFARPVARGAEPFQLLDDDAAVLFLPVPDATEEGFAAEIVAVTDGALFLEGFLDHGLGGDAGVVGAGQPEDLFAFHARLARKDILDRIVQHVTEREDTGDVRGRNDDGVGGFGRRGVGREALPLDPAVVPFGFDGLGFVVLGEFSHDRRVGLRWGLELL